MTSQLGGGLPCSLTPTHPSSPFGATTLFGVLANQRGGGAEHRVTQVDPANLTNGQKRRAGSSRAVSRTAFCDRALGWPGHNYRHSVSLIATPVGHLRLRKWEGSFTRPHACWDCDIGAGVCLLLSCFLRVFLVQGSKNAHCMLTPEKMRFREPEVLRGEPKVLSWDPKMLIWEPKMQK